jgi:hypothetical protein
VVAAEKEMEMVNCDGSRLVEVDEGRVDSSQLLPPKILLSSNSSVAAGQV